MDRILLHGIQFRGRHGVLPEEEVTGGHFSVDVEIEADLRQAGKTDALEDTVDYGEVYRIVRTIGEEERFQLIEALARRFAEVILALPNVRGVKIRLRKHHPPVAGVVDYAGVEIERRIERKPEFSIPLEP